MAGTMADHIFKAMCNRIHDDLEDMQRHIEIIRQLLPKFFPQNLIDQTTCDESFSEEVVVQACDELSHRGKDEHTHERQGKIGESTLKGKECIVLLDNPRAKVSLIPWGNVSKCASLLDTLLLKLHESQLVDAKLSICLKKRECICLNALSSPVHVFILDSVLYYLFAYDDIHASFGFALSRGIGLVGWSTCLNDKVMLDWWTLIPIVAPCLMRPLEEVMKQLCFMVSKTRVALLFGLSDAITNFVVSLFLDTCHSHFLYNILTKLFMTNTKDSWLYLKYVPPCHDDVICCTNPYPYAMRKLCWFVLSLFF
ncbi:putative protein isoform X2 [Capsicum annuum]